MSILVWLDGLYVLEDQTRLHFGFVVRRDAKTPNSVSSIQLFSESKMRAWDFSFLELNV